MSRRLILPGEPLAYKTGSVVPKSLLFANVDAGRGIFPQYRISQVPRLYDRDCFVAALLAMT